uniref:Diacylglycerol O-acyltransferase n=1 Tax=Zooxanthella nutricula TaxID=1333877 RepID=A0A7S2M6T0_9DINO
MTYEEILCAWRDKQIKPAWQAWIKNSPLFQVAVTSTGPNEFALIVELNHVLGDGDTFYKVYGMLQPGAAIVALSPERKDGFSAFLADSQGASDHLYTPSLRRCVKPVIGMVQTFCKRAVQPPRVFSVDSQWLAQQKADAPACSTNDILTSALLKGCGARYGIVPVNLRGRIPGIDCSDAGNYWRPQEILDDEFQTPLGVRGVISTATAAAPTCAEQKRGSRRPRLAQAGRIGFVTNWTAFYRDLDLPGCEQLLHMPLMRSKQMSRSYFVIFRPAKGQVAVWCAARDAGVAKGLEKLPVFSASVGMLA